MIKRVLSIVLVLIVLLLCVSNDFFADAQSGIKTVEDQRMFDYLQSGSNKRLILRDNYGYMTTIDKFNSDVTFLYLLNMCDLLIDTGVKPDKNKYIEVLTNIIASYDYDNASDISKQKEMDNLKGLKDYALDVTSMATDAISVMTGLNAATTPLESGISKAMDGLSLLSENTDNWIEALSDLETIIQDYSAHYEFLELIAQNAEDTDLTEAAKSLQANMSKAINIKLEMYNDISDKNFQNYQEFFFSDVLFDAIKQTPDYASDDSLKFFTDCGDKIISNAFVLKDSWDLGIAIGKMVGNLVVGGENLIDRTLEMMAVHDISIILSNELTSVEIDFLNNLNGNDNIDRINRFINLSQYLIVARIRGEYCIYSIVAKDAGLLSWFNKESQEDAKKWYDNKVELICAIQSELLSIRAKTTDFVSDKYLVEYDGVIYGVDKDGLWKNESGYAKEPLAKHSATNITMDGQTIYYVVYNKTVDYYPYSSTSPMKSYQYDMYSYDLNTGKDQKVFSFVECGKPICAIGDTIYYTDYPDDFDGNVVERAHGICSYNTSTGEKKYITDGAHLVQSYGGKIFYRDIMATIPSGNTHQIYSYDTATGKIEIISDPSVMGFKIISGKVYYNTLKETTSSHTIKVCSYDISSGSTKTLYEKTSSNIINVKDYDDKYLIYSEKRLDGDGFIMVDLDSENEKTIPPSLFEYDVPSQAIRDNDRTVFYTDYSGGHVYTIDDNETKMESTLSSYSWQRLLKVKNDTAFSISNDSKNYYEYYISYGRVS